MIKKLALTALMIASAGCARFTYMPQTVQGDGWSFEAPGMNWQFTEGSTVVGTSLTNVGSRPMTVQVYKLCGEERELTSDGIAHHDELVGYAVKYIGGRLGMFEATWVDKSRPDGSSTLFFTAKIPQGECTWTFVCQGDVKAAAQVESICKPMMSSLEFHR